MTRCQILQWLQLSKYISNINSEIHLRTKERKEQMMKSNANDDDQRKVRSYSMMIGHLQETARSDTSVVEHQAQLNQQSAVISELSVKMWNIQAIDDKRHRSPSVKLAMA